MKSYAEIKERIDAWQYEWDVAYFSTAQEAEEAWNILAESEDLKIKK